MSVPICRTIVCNRFKLLDDLISLAGDEYLLAPSAFSKVGDLTFEQSCIAAYRLKKAGARLVLLWDRIEKDQGIERGLKNLKKWLPELAALRVQDPGVALAVKQTYPQLPVQLSLEQNSPNSASIKRWAGLLEPERLVLSNQFPLRYIETLDQAQLPPLELPVLGPLEVFYSPRALLSADQSRMELDAISEERPRQVSRLKQTEAGTVMYHPRDLFLLDQLNLIKAAGVGYVKIEPRDQQQCQWLASCQSSADFKAIKHHWSPKVTRGFFSANRTDRPLKRLSNQSLAPHREGAIGEVIESKKGSHTLILFNKQVELPCRIKLINPEGHQTFFRLDQLKTLAGTVVQGSAEPGLYLAPWSKGALARSLLLVEFTS